MITIQLVLLVVFHAQKFRTIKLSFGQKNGEEKFFVLSLCSSTGIQLYNHLIINIKIKFI